MRLLNEFYNFDWIFLFAQQNIGHRCDRIQDDSDGDKRMNFE